MVLYIIVSTANANEIPKLKVSGSQQLYDGGGVAQLCCTTFRLRIVQLR